MEFIVRSCTREEDGRVIALCGGWCCYHLDFRNFPDGEWHRSPCTSLRHGICIDYSDRPLACIGAPFYDGGPELYPSGKFPLPPWCYFRKEILDLHQIPYEILDSGEECIEAYKKCGLNFTRWWERTFYQEPKFIIESIPHRDDSDDDGYPD